MKVIPILFLALLNFVLSDEPLYISNTKRLTFNGTNAEAYFSNDGTKIIFQAIRDNFKCDQIYSMNVDGSDIRLIGTGQGRSTCSFFLPGNKEFIYSSTMDSMGEGCPPNPDNRYGYVWPVYRSMALYKAEWPSGKIIQTLSQTGAYDAEATLNPQGDTILFTSARDGDLELYSMNLNGTKVKRLTLTPGYDGGAFYSNDGKKIVWRANRPKGQDLREYLDLLSLGYVHPVTLPMEIYIMDADGFNQKQVTNLKAASFAPFFIPKDNGIIFSSDLGIPHGPFHLYITNLSGDKVIKLTDKGTFNSFPMFSRDGKKLAWVSNRAAENQWGGMDVYIADWNGDIDWDKVTSIPFPNVKPSPPSTIWIILVINFICISLILTFGVGIFYLIKRMTSK